MFARMLRHWFEDQASSIAHRASVRFHGARVSRRLEAEGRRFLAAPAAPNYLPMKFFHACSVVIALHFDHGALDRALVVELQTPLRGRRQSARRVGEERLSRGDSRDKRADEDPSALRRLRSDLG